MKQFMVAVVFCCCFSPSLIYAQTGVLGIYLSADDYINHKLSYGSYKQNNTKIKLFNSFYKPYIEVKTVGLSIKLNKDSIFGYRDNNQKDFRFNSGDERVYQIIEQKNGIVYLANTPVISPKGNAIQLVQKFYYSNSLTSPILPLIKN